MSDKEFADFIRCSYEENPPKYAGSSFTKRQFKLITDIPFEKMLEEIQFAETGS